MSVQAFRKCVYFGLPPFDVSKVTTLRLAGAFLERVMPCAAVTATSATNEWIKREQICGKTEIDLGILGSELSESAIKSEEVMKGSISQQKSDSVQTATSIIQSAHLSICGYLDLSIPSRKLEIIILK